MFQLFNKEYSLKNLLFGIFLILCLIFSFTNVDIALMLFVSLVFACSMNPLVDKLENKMPRPAATALVLFSALLILGILLAFIFLLGAYQIYELIKAFPTYVSHLDEAIRNIPILQQLGITKIDTDGILTTISNSSENLIDHILHFTSGIGSGLVYCLTGLIFIFFFVQDKKNIKETVMNYFPTSVKERAEEIMNTIGTKIGGYVIAQTMAVSSVFLFNLIFLAIFNVPYAMSVAIITAILDIVPVVGPGIAIVICLIGVSECGLKAVITTLIVTILAQIVENNVVRPIAFSKLMDLHPTIIFLSLILGAKYFGFIGVLFGPAMASAICVLLNELYVRNIK